MSLQPPPIRAPLKLTKEVEDMKFWEKLLASVYQIWDALHNMKLTASLTTITHTAPGTPDYAIQDLTTTSPYGFVTKDEGNTVLSVIVNLQTQIDELKAKIEPTVG